MPNSSTSPSGSHAVAVAGFAIAGALLVNTLVLAWGLVRIKTLAELYNQVMVSTLPERANQSASILPKVDSLAIQVDLYSDFDCAFCRRSVPAVLDARQQFGTRVLWRYWYRANPARPISLRSALVAMCTAEGDGPWKLYALLSDSASLTEGRLTNAVRALGLPFAKTDRCARADSTAQRLWRQMFFSAAAGRTRTPTVVVDGIEIAGLLNADALRALIEDRLARKRHLTGATSPAAGL